jgi:hypothetical protein
VFFLDESANVMAAVSDRYDNMKRVYACVLVCVFLSSLRVAQITLGVICNRRGGAVVSDFRSAADVVRSPSIGKQIFTRVSSLTFSGLRFYLLTLLMLARARTDFTCGDAFGDHIALGCSDGTVLVYDQRQLQVNSR